MVLDFLDKLGQQITTTSQQVFEIYTKQAYVTGITDLIISAVLLIFMIGNIVFAYKTYKKLDTTDSLGEKENENLGMGVLLSGVAGVIAFIVFCALLTHGVQALINPQYFAIQDVIQTIK
jgi:hypothetical protein